MFNFACGWKMQSRKGFDWKLSVLIFFQLCCGPSLNYLHFLFPPPYLSSEIHLVTSHSFLTAFAATLSCFQRVIVDVSCVHLWMFALAKARTKTTNTGWEATLKLPTSVQHLPPIQKPCGTNHIRPWLAYTMGHHLTTATLVYVGAGCWFCRVPGFLRGKSWVWEQMPNQHSASSTVGQWHSIQASKS